MVQFAESERQALLGYATQPTLDRGLVTRYALGERQLAAPILEPFRSARFERVWQDLIGLALPAVAIEYREGAPAGRSKLGGQPDLPISASWPRRREKPLTFVAQLDLEEIYNYLRDPALPRSGLLSFFYEADEWTSGSSPADQGAWRVMLLEGSLSPQKPPAASPPAVPDYYDPAKWGYEEGDVRFVPRISLPEAEHVLTVRAGVGDDDYEAYGALMDELRQRHGLAGVTQLLGYPAEIQHDPFVTTQLVTNGVDTLTLEDWESKSVRNLLENRDPWRLLLQVDSVSEIGMEWADSGLLYYCLRDEDLRAGKWDSSWLVMDSL